MVFIGYNLTFLIVFLPGKLFYLELVVVCLCTKSDYVLWCSFNVDIDFLLVFRIDSSDNFVFVILVKWEEEYNLCISISLDYLIWHIFFIVKQEIYHCNF